VSSISGLHPYIVPLPTDLNSRLKFMLTLFSSNVVLEVLELFEPHSELCQRDIIAKLKHHSNKSVIIALKKLVELGLLAAETRIEARNNRKVRVKCYSLTEAGKWYNLLLKDSRRLSKDDLRYIAADLTLLFLSRILPQVKQLEVDVQSFLAKTLINALKASTRSTESERLDLVVFGSSALDIYLKPQIRIFFGGSGANVAVAASMLGLKTAFVSKIPGNIFGAAILSRLVDIGVSVELVEIDEELETPACIVEDPLESLPKCNYGFNSPNPPVLTSLNSKVIDLCSRAQAIYLGEGVCSLYYTLLRELGEKIRDKIVVFRPLKESLQHYLDECLSVLSFSPILILNAHKVEILRGMGVKVPEDLFRYGAKTVIVTAGHRGAEIYSDSRSSPITIPAPQVNPIDVIGAGDVFAATLIYYMLQGLDLEESVRRAVEMASQSTLQLGPQKYSASRIAMLQHQFTPSQ